MSIHTTESRASVLALDATQRYLDAMAASEASLKEAFLEMARAGDMTALATFAPMVRDYTQSMLVWESRPYVYQSFGQVLAESLDYEDMQQQAMNILCHLAHGDALPKAAHDLLNRAADKFAHLNAEAE